MLTLLESSGKLKKGNVTSGVERDMDSLMGCVERIAAFDRRKIIAAGEFDREACAQSRRPTKPDGSAGGRQPNNASIPASINPPNMAKRIAPRGANLKS